MGGILLPVFGDLAGQQGTVVPSQIPNLNLWYNASADTTVFNGSAVANFQATLANGAEITKWKDVTSLGQDANVYNAGGGNGPTYQTSIQNSLSAAFYQSANKCNLDINPIGSWAKNQAGFTVYTALKVTSLPAGTAKQILVTDANLGHQWSGSYWQVGAAGGLATAQSTTVSTAAWTIHGMIFDGSYVNVGNQTDQNNGRLKYRYNKAAQALTFSSNPGTATSNAASVFYVGGNNRNNPKSYMDGYIGEVLMWTRALSMVEQTQVESYLSSKWNV